MKITDIKIMRLKEYQYTVLPHKFGVPLIHQCK